MHASMRLLLGLASIGLLLLSSRFGVNAHQAASIQPIAGTWDSAFGQHLQQPATISSLTLDNNGDLYALGDFHYVNGVEINGLTKWNGTTWQTFNLEPDDINKIRAVTTYSDTLYVAGQFKTLQHRTLYGVAAWDGNGFQALGQGLSGTLEQGPADPIAYALHVYSDTLYIGGNFTFFNERFAFGIGQWNGAAISQSTEFNQTVSSFISTSDGLIAAGEFWTVDFQPAQLARREHNQWVPIDLGWSMTASQGYTINDTPYLVTRSKYDPYPSQLYRWQNNQLQLIGPTHPASIDMLVGFDNTFYMQSKNKLWFLNQNQWVPAQLPFTISDLTALASDGEKLYLAGDLTVAGQPSQIVAWDGLTAQSLGSFVSKQNLQTIAGDFGQPMIITKHEPAADLGTIQRWNGSQWAKLTIGDITTSQVKVHTINQQAYVLLQQPRALTSAVPASNIWYWDNGHWQSGVLSTTIPIKWHQSGQQLFTYLVPLESNLPITGVVEFDGQALNQRIASDYISEEKDSLFTLNNDFYLVTFDEWHWTASLYVRRWSGSDWRLMHSQSVSNSAPQFAVWNNQLYMGNSNGTLSRFNQLMQPVEIAQFDGPITTMQALEGGGLYIGGDFMQVDGVPTGPIARFDGSNFSGLEQYPNGVVRKLAVDYNQLYVVGDFTKVGHIDSLGVGVFSFATPVVTPIPTATNTQTITATNTPMPTNSPMPTIIATNIPTTTISPTSIAPSYRVYIPLTWAKLEE